MAGFRRRMNCVLSTVFPEKRLFIQSRHTTRYLRVTPISQAGLLTGALLAAGWMAIATSATVLNFVSPDADETGTAVFEAAYSSRLAELATERDARAAEARAAQDRFQVAMKQISQQQTRILAAVEERRELSTALDLMRNRLQAAVSERDAAIEAHETVATQLDAKDKGPDGADLDATLRTVADSLSATAAERDAAKTERRVLAQRLADMQLHADVNARRQDQMIDEVERAVSTSFGSMQEVFANASIDVDDLLDKVRTTFSGQGGPDEPAAVSTRSFDGGIQNPRFDSMMLDLDRMNLLRIAAGKVPLALPLHDTFRFTSGFGVRHDPTGRGRRMHAGVDMAGSRGTPIYATADGVVTAAGRESGYGNVVKIRHEFGYETVYAHQSKIRVKLGQRVSRGDRIGDMGNTGRSTGVHLHYEVHVNGTPVNPMTYLEAAKDVF